MTNQELIANAVEKVWRGKNISTKHVLLGVAISFGRLADLAAEPKASRLRSAAEDIRKMAQSLEDV